MIAAIVAAAMASTPQLPCRVSHPERCRNGNDLAWAPDFEPSVRRLIGQRPANYLYPGGSAASQALEVFGGPPGMAGRTGPFYRFTACRLHSCDEKGAAVLAKGAGLVAFAILHTSCGQPKPAAECYSHYTLTIFTRRAGRSGEVLRDLSDWARRELADAYIAPGQRANSLDAVRTIAVDERRAAGRPKP